jgi:hypothetical protein
MAKYSVQSDICDELIKQYSQRSDHIEAEEYVDKVLSKLGIDTSKVEATSLLKRLAVTYATYKRAFYEFKTKDDVFHQKYIAYEKELKDLTADLIRKSADEDDVKAGSKVFAEIFRG